MEDSVKRRQKRKKKRKESVFPLLGAASFATGYLALIMTGGWVLFTTALDRVDTRFDEFESNLMLNLDLKFETIDARFVEMDRRFEQVDRRFEQVDRRFEQIDKSFDSLGTRMNSMESHIADLRERVTRIEVVLIGSPPAGPGVEP